MDHFNGRNMRRSKKKRLARKHRSGKSVCKDVLLTLSSFRLRHNTQAIKQKMRASSVSFLEFFFLLFPRSSCGSAPVFGCVPDLCRRLSQRLCVCSVGSWRARNDGACAASAHDLISGGKFSAFYLVFLYQLLLSIARSLSLCHALLFCRSALCGK